MTADQWEASNCTSETLIGWLVRLTKKQC